MARGPTDKVVPVGGRWGRHKPTAIAPAITEGGVAAATRRADEGSMVQPAGLDESISPESLGWTVSARTADCCSCVGVIDLFLVGGDVEINSLQGFRFREQHNFV